MHLGIVAVPFFAANAHRAYAELTLSTIRSKHQITKIAVVNRSRPEKGDDHWITSNFDIVQVNDKNILARAWNTGIRIAFQQSCDYVVVINLDVLFHHEHFDRLITFAESQRSSSLLWSGYGVPNPELLDSGQPAGTGMGYEVNFCAFMLDNRLFEQVGCFDEQFAPAYHEDKDMLYRMKLAGKQGVHTETALFYHFEQGTMAGLLEDYYAKKGLEVFDDASLGAQAAPSAYEIKSTEELYADTSLMLFGETTVGVQATGARYAKKWGGPPGSERFTSPYGKNVLGE